MQFFGEEDLDFSLWSRPALGELWGRGKSLTHIMEAASLLKLAGDTLSRGSVYLWEPLWALAEARLLWNPGTAQGELWLWDAQRLGRLPWLLVL